MELSNKKLYGMEPNQEKTQYLGKEVMTKMIRFVVVEAIVLVLLALTIPSASAQAKPGCQETCGNLSIPYPFGITDACSIDQDFLITCDEDSNPFLGTSNLKVVNISIESGELSILGFTAHDCYVSGQSTTYSESWLTLDKFPVSHKRNKFTTVGCDATALIQGFEPGKYATGCIAMCYEFGDVVNGSCSGIGCCQTPIPEGIWGFNLTVDSFFNHSNVGDFNPCSYAFVVEEGKFNFSSLDLSVDNFTENARFPVALDWAIGNKTCEQDPEARHVCKNNSFCIDSTIRSGGFHCTCSRGFRGNPYLEPGCQDVNECEDPNLNLCTNICSNNEGGYNCSCPQGYHGKGTRESDGCVLDSVTQKPQQQQIWVKVSVGLGIGVTALLVCITWLWWGVHKWKAMKLKDKFFRQNGGLMLQQELSLLDGSNTTTLIFTGEELKKATNNYDETKVVGRGGYGTVFKGTLSDGRVVAIKKSKVVDQTQIEQFINEMIILSKINHRNVVKLLGCCLETEVPLLVYEFVSNGTLFDHIHDKNNISSLSWEVRLRVAAETAGVLAYLHSAASPPIIHRDVKTTNILLDDSYTAKVSDFGASRLVPLDQLGMSTMVQGTLGYLDPEYLHTSQLTDKSDVYSFGVVLMELLTGQKALSFERPEQTRSLAMYFLSALKEDGLFEILDEGVAGNIEGEIEVEVKEVAELARRCIRVKGEERPSMKEVAMELEGLRMMVKHPWINSEDHEGEHLLEGSWDNVVGDDRVGSTFGYDNSITNHITLRSSDAR